MGFDSLRFWLNWKVLFQTGPKKSSEFTPEQSFQPTNTCGTFFNDIEPITEVILKKCYERGFSNDYGSHMLKNMEIRGLLGRERCVWLESESVPQSKGRNVKRKGADGEVTLNISLLKG